MDTPAQATADAAAAATTRTVAQIAQDLLAASTSTADERRLAAWVLDHDEHAEATIVSQSRLTDRLDAMAKRGKQRALAAGGALVARLAPAANVTTDAEHQDAPVGGAPAAIEHAADATEQH